MRFLTEYEWQEITILSDDAILMIKRKSNDQIQQLLASEVLRLRQLIRNSPLDC